MSPPLPARVGLGLDGAPESPGLRDGDVLYLRPTGDLLSELGGHVEGPRSPDDAYAASTTLTGKDARGAYRYSLRTTHNGAIPTGTNPVVHDRQLAAVQATYASQGCRRAVAVRSDVPSTREELMPFVPDLRTALPSRVTEHYSPGSGWTHYLDIFGTTQNRPDGSLPDHEETSATRRYRARHTYRIDWNRAPVRPAVYSAKRTGSDLVLDLTPYAATGAGQQLDDSPEIDALTGEAVLSSGGRVIDPADIALTARHRSAPVHPHRPHRPHGGLNGSRHPLLGDLGVHLGAAPRLGVLDAATAHRARRRHRRPHQCRSRRPRLPPPRATPLRRRANRRHPADPPGLLRRRPHLEDRPRHPPRGHGRRPAPPPGPRRLRLMRGPSRISRPT